MILMIKAESQAESNQLTVIISNESFDLTLCLVFSKH